MNGTRGAGLLIAKREWDGFFSTWSAYIIGAGALFLTGLLFNAFAVGDSAKYSADVVSDFFYYTSGVVLGVAVLLSMRLLAEERQMGTLVYLRTSPITARQIVYGKALSSFGLNAAFQLLTLPLPLLVLLHGKISLGHICAGYLGLLALAAAATAIVTFGSALAATQLLAAVIGGVILVALLLLWMIAPLVGAPFQDLFSYMALHNQHFPGFARGSVSLASLVYYTSVTLFFLEAAVRAFELNNREN